MAFGHSILIQVLFLFQCIIKLRCIRDVGADLSDSSVIEIDNGAYVRIESPDPDVPDMHFHSPRGLSYRFGANGSVGEKESTNDTDNNTLSMVPLRGHSEKSSAAATESASLLARTSESSRAEGRVRSKKADADVKAALLDMDGHVVRREDDRSGDGSLVVGIPKFVWVLVLFMVTVASTVTAMILSMMDPVNFPWQSKKKAEAFHFKCAFDYDAANHQWDVETASDHDGYFDNDDEEEPVSPDIGITDESKDIQAIPADGFCEDDDNMSEPEPMETRKVKMMNAWQSLLAGETVVVGDCEAWVERGDHYPDKNAIDYKKASQDVSTWPASFNSSWETLVEGSYGQVYAGQLGSSEVCAKVSNSSGDDDALIKEGWIYETVKGTHIANLFFRGPIMDGKLKGKYGLILEKLDCTLLQYQKEYAGTTGDPQLPVSTVQRIANGTLEALKYIHAKGIIHQNVSNTSLTIVNKEDPCTIKLLGFEYADTVGASGIIGRTKSQNLFASTNHHWNRLVGSPICYIDDLESFIYVALFLRDRTAWMGSTVEANASRADDDIEEDDEKMREGKEAFWKQPALLLDDTSDDWLLSLTWAIKKLRDQDHQDRKAVGMPLRRPNAQFYNRLLETTGVSFHIS